MDSKQAEKLVKLMEAKQKVKNGLYAVLICILLWLFFLGSSTAVIIFMLRWMNVIN